MKYLILILLLFLNTLSYSNYVEVNERPITLFNQGPRCLSFSKLNSWSKQFSSFEKIDCFVNYDTFFLWESQITSYGILAIELYNYYYPSERRSLGGDKKEYDWTLINI
jgi:hypothetical protein